MITSLSVKNFKSWESLEKIRFSKLTGFFGSNSSGKTSLIQLLLMLKQTVQSSDRTQVLDFGNENKYVDIGTFQDLIFNHDTKRKFEFGISWDLNEKLRLQIDSDRTQVIHNLSFNSSISQTKKGTLYVNEFNYGLNEGKIRIQRQPKEKYKLAFEKNESVKTKFDFKRTIGRVWQLPEPEKFYGFPNQIKSYYQNADFLPDLQLKLEREFQNIYYLGPLRDYPKRQYIWSGSQPEDMGIRGEKSIEAILVSRVRGTKISPGYKKRKKTLEEFIAIWLKELGLIHSFRVQELVEGQNLYQVLVRKNKSSPEVLITEVGFGVSQILPVITLCFYAKEGSTIIIEQPEIHLHPKVQAGLADVLIEAIRIKNIQIILESHSEHLLKRLQRRIAEEKFSNEDAALYFCDSKNGHSEISELELDLFGTIKNWPKEFFGDEMGEIAETIKAIQRRKANG